MKKHWTSADIKKFYRFVDRSKPIQALYNAEEKGEIPTASRIDRGKVKVRTWPLEQVPEIGRKIGFLSPPSKQKVVSKFMQKGGVLKTSTTFNEAIAYALHGIKTLIVGLDSELSITDIFFPQMEISNLDEHINRAGLYQFFAEDVSLDKIIMKTPIPTLDILPENHSLVALDKWINHQTRRESLFKKKLIPLLKEYDVIIFDNGPSWNNLIENSITASSTIICPLGCNLLAYNASQTNIENIFEFRDQMGIKDQTLIMYATLLERTALSQQIYAQYLINFQDYIIPIPIRKSVKGEEALVCQKSILEYAPTSAIAQDYYELIQTVWGKINSEERNKEKSSKLTVEKIGA